MYGTGWGGGVLWTDSNVEFNVLFLYLEIQRLDESCPELASNRSLPYYNSKIITFRQHNKALSEKRSTKWLPT